MSMCLSETYLQGNRLFLLAGNASTKSWRRWRRWCRHHPADWDWVAIKDFTTRLYELPFETGTIIEVNNGTMKLDDGWCLGIPNGYESWVKPGMRYALYGKPLGIVRGIVVDGKILRYVTESEQKAKDLEEQAERERRDDERWETRKEAYFKEVEALPDVLKNRFVRFREHCPTDFDKEYGDYELLCCKQATLIAEAMRDPASGKQMMVAGIRSTIGDKEVSCWDANDALLNLEALGYINHDLNGYQFELIDKLFPFIDSGHSGNTWGCTMSLAYWLLKEPAVATQLHGAMVYLVGCEAYGCHHGA